MPNRGRGPNNQGKRAKKNGNYIEFYPTALVEPDLENLAKPNHRKKEFRKSLSALRMTDFSGLAYGGLIGRGYFSLKADVRGLGSIRS